MGILGKGNKWASTFVLSHSHTSLDHSIVCLTILIHEIKSYSDRHVSSGVRVDCIYYGKAECFFNHITFSNFCFLSSKELINRRIATFVAIIYAFATNTWATSSQGLWQHGLVELFLAICNIPSAPVTLILQIKVMPLEFYSGIIFIESPSYCCPDCIPFSLPSTNLIGKLLHISNPAIQTLL